jgi:hypothetical protein
VKTSNECEVCLNLDVTKEFTLWIHTTNEIPVRFISSLLLEEEITNAAIYLFLEIVVVHVVIFASIILTLVESSLS